MDIFLRNKIRCWIAEGKTDSQIAQKLKCSILTVRYYINHEDNKHYEYIKFYGKVSNERIIEEFCKSDIWFYPTYFTETYCISSLEAQMSGCVCITSDIGALQTTVGDRGILLSDSIVNNHKNCVSAVVDLMQDDELKTELRNKGREWAKKQDWSNMMEEWNKYIV